MVQPGATGGFFALKQTNRLAAMPSVRLQNNGTYVLLQIETILVPLSGSILRSPQYMCLSLFAQQSA